MSPSRFHRVRIHIRFLKHACPDLKVHPFDIQELREMKEELAGLGVSVIKKVPRKGGFALYATDEETQPMERHDTHQDRVNTK